MGSDESHFSVSFNGEGQQCVQTTQRLKSEENRSGLAGFQARSKDQEILEEGGGAGHSSLPRRDHE